MSVEKPPIKAFPVSWDQFHRDCRALAWRLSGQGPFSSIVSITRGGLVPAAIVARELGVRLIETVCISSYEEVDRKEGLTVLKDIASSLTTGPHKNGKGVLVIDDLTDTGRTAQVVREMVPQAHF